MEYFLGELLRKVAHLCFWIPCLFSGCIDIDQPDFLESQADFVYRRDGYAKLKRVAIQTWVAEFQEETNYLGEKYDLLCKKWRLENQKRDTHEFDRQRADLAGSLRDQITRLQDALDGTVTDDPASADPLSKFIQECVQADQVLIGMHAQLSSDAA